MNIEEIDDMIAKLQKEKDSILSTQNQVKDDYFRKSADNHWVTEDNWVNNKPKALYKLNFSQNKFTQFTFSNSQNANSYDDNQITATEWNCFDLAKHFKHGDGYMVLTDKQALDIFDEWAKTVMKIGNLQ